VSRLFDIDKELILPITSPISLALQIFDFISDIDKNKIQY